MKKDQFASVKAKVKMQKSASAKTKKQGKDYDSLLLKNLNRKSFSVQGGNPSASTGTKAPAEGLTFQQQLDKFNERMKQIKAELNARLSDNNRK